MFSNLSPNEEVYFLHINNITKQPDLYIGKILTVSSQFDPPIKQGEFRAPGAIIEKLITIRIEILNGIHEYTVAANSISVKDGDTTIYSKKDDLERSLKNQMDNYRILYESINKQKILFEKYSEIYDSVINIKSKKDNRLEEALKKIEELETKLKNTTEAKE